MMKSDCQFTLCYCLPFYPSPQAKQLRLFLLISNDEVNTFEWVIETLIDICSHTPEQAEQSAMIIHTKGKYAVKEGSYQTLKPMCDAITERGIGATVEELSER